MAERDQPERPPIDPSSVDPASNDPSSIDPSSIDPEQLRQFQQFQEFQRFQEAQRRSGGDGRPPSPRDWRSFLRWLLRRRFVRRLIRIAIVIAILLAAVPLVIDYYFGGGDSNSSNTSAGRKLPELQPSPQVAVQRLYKFVAAADADDACRLFTPEGAAAFARDFAADIHAATCQQAAQRAAGQIRDSNPGISDDTVPASGNKEISSCAVTVRSGGRLAGTFVMTKQQDGWIISDHRKEPNDCPTG